MPILLLTALVLVSTIWVAGPAVGQGSGIEVSGAIGSDTWWNLTDSPVTVTGAINVGHGVTLTIENGVTVKFKDGTGMTVNGRLKAKGVTFTSAADTPRPGDWEGIDFRDADMDDEPLVGVNILFASNALDLDSTNITVQGGRIANHEYGAINNRVGSATIKGVEINSSAGMGIHCAGPLAATNNVINGNIAVSLSDGCVGNLERNIIRADLTGITVSTRADVLISENLIVSTDPGDGFGINIGSGSTARVTKNDIVGHLYGINLGSTTAVVDGNSVRSYSGYGIYSDRPVTIDNGFWGTESPKAATMVPNAANDEIAITNPRAAPFDIVGVNQPASVSITSHKAYEMVKGEVMIAGKAYDPDPDDEIYGVEGRVKDLYEGLVEDWDYCEGTDTWVFYWDTDSLETSSYKLEFRVEQEEGYSLPDYLYLMVNPFAQEKVHLNEPSRVTETSISISWTFSDNNDFKEYRVFHSTSPIADTTKLTPATISNFFIKSTTLTKLTKNTQYFILVEVETDSGMVYTSNQVEAWTSSSGQQNWDLFGTLCLGMVLITVIPIVVVVVVVVYFLFIRPKKLKDKGAQTAATPPQPAQTAPASGHYQQSQAPAYAMASGTHGQAKEEPYIIEEVFLVYKDGRLIHHDTRRLKPDMDDQVLSGMFTAIQEFVKQSLSSIEEEEGLIKEIMYGDSRIVLEHGQYIYMAVVASDIKDTTRLHGKMAELIAAIEAEHGATLADWEGAAGTVKGAAKMVKRIFSDD